MSRRLPSPALVISLVALFVSLGGASYAVTQIGTNQIKNGAVTGKKIRNSTIRSRDVRNNSLGPHAIAESKLRVGFAFSAGAASGMANYAVIQGPSGLLARGRNVNSAVRTGKGRYQVIFNQNVRNCGYIASLGLVGATAPPNGEISTAPLASNVNGVAVRTFSSGGAFEDHSFHLVVTC
jgi:hypothetical protein